MKITPLEIRQKDFEKKLRGYDKDEVSAFLLSLSNEWERVLDENKELNIKLQHAEKEVGKLREVESSLYKTLKTAEDTGANLIDQSNKAAELHMKETQMKAEALMSEAKSKAKAMMEKAEVEARQIIEELQEAVKNIEQNHRDIENHRHNAIAELKNLSVDLIEKVERTSKEQKEFRFDDYVKRVKELARESGDRIKKEDTELNMPETPKIEEAIEKTIGDNEVTDLPESEEKQEPIAQAEVEPEPEETPTKEPDPISEVPESEPEPEPNSSEVDQMFEEPGAASEVEAHVEEDRIEENEPEAKEEKPEEEETAEQEEKAGPRISHTVSFFDEIDDKD